MRAWITISLIGAVWAAAAFGAEPSWAVGNEVPDKPGSDFTLSTGETFYLEIIDNKFHAVFIDEERIAVMPPVPRLILQERGAHPRLDDFTLALTPNGGPVYSHPRIFPPPHDFWFVIVIPRENGDPETLPRTRFRQ